jgi:SAM-dependent methyltransferase
MPAFLAEGWVEGIEFRNSMVVVRKAMEPSHAKLGSRVISGNEASVDQRALKLRADQISASSAATDPARALVRLNLGCGDKILPGYVNVDVVEARAGKTPDVLCDLRELTPFSADYADEILSVHVVEHFWRWEVEAVLKEWLRVLKPGGKLILECPNLQAACEEFLEDPDRRSAPGQEGQTTMWVFYGDPKWKDPLMVHRWGYTPRSLGRMLESIGLVDVRQEPAQFKLREPRDMRIVGHKP